jgi:hypothetical protein
MSASVGMDAAGASNNYLKDNTIQNPSSGASNGGLVYPIVNQVGHLFLIIIDIFLYLYFSGWSKWKHMV